MPKEERLLGYGVGSKMTQQQGMTPEGPAFDEQGMPVMIPVLELILIDQMSGDIVIIPLTPEGVEAVKRAINPSGLVIAQPGQIP